MQENYSYVKDMDVVIQQMSRAKQVTFNRKKCLYYQWKQKKKNNGDELKGHTYSVFIIEESLQQKCNKTIWESKFMMEIEYIQEPSKSSQNTG